MAESNSEQALPLVHNLTLDESPLFWVTNQDVHHLVPEIAAGEDAIKRTVAVLTPQAPEPAPGPKAGETVTIKTLRGRDQNRSVGKLYGSHITQIARLGAGFIATFDDHKEGVAALNEIYTQASQGSDVLGLELEKVLAGVFVGNILPAVEPLRHLRHVSQQIGANVMTLATRQDQTSLPDRYLLLKALGGDVSSHKTNGIIRLSQIEQTSVASNRVLSVLTVLSNKGVKTVLSADARKGLFDPLIGADIIKYVDEQEKVDGDLGKIGKLMTFAKKLLGDGIEPTEVYRRMVEEYDSWPVAQQQVVHNGRQVLLDRLDANLDLATKFAKSLCLITEGDHGDELAANYKSLADILLRNITVTPDIRAEVLRLRASAKRGRQTPRRQREKSVKKGVEAEAATREAEEPRKPLNLVTCNLATYDTTEGVDGLIDQYLENVSQGNETLRKDVEAVLAFMRRTDLPPDFNRGTKKMENVFVRFGTPEDPDKIWQLWEMKPKEASGLPTKTPNAKDLRVYYIKLNDDTLGIINLSPRSQQDEVIKGIRVKVKNRG